jgi:hypothetical protein
MSYRPDNYTAILAKFLPAPSYICVMVTRETLWTGFAALLWRGFPAFGARVEPA